MQGPVGLTEVDDNQLNSDPDTVEDIVLPANVVKTDGVDVLVEDQSDLDEQVHQHETLSTNVERQDLDGVGDQKTGPGEVIGGGVNEDHGNDGLSGSWVPGDSELGRTNRPDSEGDKHTSSGGKEERTTAKLVDSEGHSK